METLLAEKMFTKPITDKTAYSKLIILCGLPSLVHPTALTFNALLAWLIACK
jgi:hypothetical protein